MHSEGDNMFLLSLVTPPESRVGCGSVPTDNKMSGLPSSVHCTLIITTSYVWAILLPLFPNVPIVSLLFWTSFSKFFCLLPCRADSSDVPSDHIIVWTHTQALDRDCIYIFFILTCFYLIYSVFCKALCHVYILCFVFTTKCKRDNGFL